MKIKFTDYFKNECAKRDMKPEEFFDIDGLNEARLNVPTVFELISGNDCEGEVEVLGKNGTWYALDVNSFVIIED